MRDEGLKQAQKEVVFEVMLREGHELLDLVETQGLEAVLRRKDELVAKAVEAIINELQSVGPVRNRTESEGR